MNLRTNGIRPTPRGMTVAGYVNSDVPGTCFSSGFDAASEFHQKRIEKLREALRQIIINAPDQSNPKNYNKYAFIARAALQEETK